MPRLEIRPGLHQASESWGTSECTEALPVLSLACPCARYNTTSIRQHHSALHLPGCYPNTPHSPPPLLIRPSAPPSPTPPPPSSPPPQTRFPGSTPSPPRTSSSPPPHRRPSPRTLPDYASQRRSPRRILQCGLGVRWRRRWRGLWWPRSGRRRRGWRGRWGGGEGGEGGSGGRAIGRGCSLWGEKELVGMLEREGTGARGGLTEDDGVAGWLGDQG